MSEATRPILLRRSVSWRNSHLPSLFTGRLSTAALRSVQLSAILLLFVLLGVVYSVANPLFESPDEVWHYEYVRWLVEGHGLPRPEDVGTAPWHQEGSQPPLYYLAAAAITRPIATGNAAEVIHYNPHAAIGRADSFGNRNMIVPGRSHAWPWQGVALAAHLARLLSLLFGALTVYFTFRTAERIFPAQNALAALAAALVAFNPQFLFISVSVNNDNLVTMLCAAGLFVLTAIGMRRDPQRAGLPAAPAPAELLTLGLIAGLAAVSKLSGLLFGLYAGLVLVVLAWRRRAPGELLRWGLWMALPALPIAGVWYVRNWLVFGDPLALSAMFEILPRRAEPPTAAELWARGQSVWRSFWAVFGWFNVPAAPWLYHLYTALALAGLTGLALPARWAPRQHSADDGGARRFALWLLAFWALLVLFFLWRWAQMRYPQGRLLFPALSAWGVLLAYGLLRLPPTRWQPRLALGLSTLLFALALLAPLRWIAPAYAAPDPLPAGAALPNPLEARFGGQIELAGYQLSADELRPGEELAVDLFWRGLAPVEGNYSVFVHLTDENELVQAQSDSYPGAGSVRTSELMPDAVLPDRHLVAVPATVPAPTRLRVDVGLYDAASGARLPVGDSDSLALGHVVLLPRSVEGDLPHPVDIRFDDQIALVGFDFDRRLLQPGEELGLTLWWEALRPLDEDYRVFVHLVQGEAVWAQEDDDPQEGAARTSTWVEGQRIEDRYQLRLPEEAPPGVYFVEIGLYDRNSFDRLKVNFSDKGIVLGQVRVAE